MKRIAALALVIGVAFSACSKPADIASTNISTAADSFEILRRVVFYNGITGDYMLTIEGFCSLGNSDKVGELSVTCKIGSGYKKSFLGLSDNVSYFVEQLDSANIDPNHYRVIFKPSVILPDIDVK